MAPAQIRCAMPEDAAAVMSILVEVAAEVPVLLEPDERRTLLLNQVCACCGGGASLVAIDDADEIVGFLLAEPDGWERFRNDNGALHLPYGGVRRSRRGARIFPALAEAMMRRGVPLTVEVKRANTSDMVSRLTKLGFTQTTSSDDQDDLRWQPPAGPPDAA